MILGESLQITMQIADVFQNLKIRYMIGGENMYQKRILVCLFGGVIAAIICLAGSQIIFNFPPITWNSVAATMANRLLLGFVIGISGWRINYLLHGAILGLIVSLSVSIGFLPVNSLGFFLYTVAGVFYGILIEWLSTRVFKAPMKIT